jgi:hypothetical protein
MTGDIVQMGAYIGAGLACTGMGGAAVPRSPVADVRSLIPPFLKFWGPCGVLVRPQVLEELIWQTRQKT